MVTIHPLRAIISNKVGIAVIALLFSPVFTGANTNRFSVAQALTRWMALLSFFTSFLMRSPCVLPKVCL
jgi:hypothetical protein